MPDRNIGYAHTFSVLRSHTISCDNPMPLPVYIGSALKTVLSQILVYHKIAFLCAYEFVKPPLKGRGFNRIDVCEERIVVFFYECENLWRAL